MQRGHPANSGKYTQGYQQRVGGRIYDHGDAVANEKQFVSNTFLQQRRRMGMSRDQDCYVTVLL